MRKGLTITGSILLVVSIFLILSASALAWFPHGPFDRDLTAQEKIYTLHANSAYTLGLRGVVRGCLTGSSCDFEVQFYDWDNDEWDTVFSGNVADDATKHYSADIAPFTRLYDEDTGMYAGYMRTFSNLQGLADYNDIDLEVCDPQRINEENNGLYPEYSDKARFNRLCERFIIIEYSNKICEYGRIGTYEKWTGQQGRYAEIANTCYNYDATCFLNTAVKTQYPVYDNYDFYECAGKAIDLNNNRYVEDRQVRYRLIKDDYDVEGFNAGDNFFEIRTLAATNPYTAYTSKLAQINNYYREAGLPTVTELPALLSRGDYQQPQYSLISDASEFLSTGENVVNDWLLQNQVYIYIVIGLLGVTLLGIGLVGDKK